MSTLGHHAALTCKRCGDVVFRHSKIRDVVSSCLHHCKSRNWQWRGRELQHTVPTDILASNWLCGRPAAFGLSVTSHPYSLKRVPCRAGSAAVATELRKHSANNVKYSELGWSCSPLGVESYGT